MVSDQPLYWETTFAIARALQLNHPELDPEELGVAELEGLIVALPNFADDPNGVTERILVDVLLSWYEEFGAE